VKTGQLITSFLQGKASPTMTSTIFNPYVDPATVASKIGYYKESPGETQDTNRGGYKGWGRVLRAMNDALPYKLRPIKAKRRRARRTYGWRHELFAFRMVWHSHHGPALAKKIESIKKLVWKR
jgi:hypothetical protein